MTTLVGTLLFDELMQAKEVQFSQTFSVIIYMLKHLLVANYSFYSIRCWKVISLHVLHIC